MATIFGILFWLFLQQQPLTTIEGTAVRSGSAETASNLRVELWPTTLVANTDVYGKFGFAGVGAGTYTLFVESNGIRNRTPITILPGQRLATIELKIAPGPTISGKIFDHNGERAAGVRVQALQLKYSAYGRRMRSVASTLTNDQGEYRLSRLQPGEYYVSASYSDADQRLEKAELRLTPNLSKPDEGLPTTYFGGSFNASESSRVNVGPGFDSANVDIFLKDGQRFNVSGQIIQGCARLALVPEGGMLNADTDFIHAFCGSFEIKGVSPGVYFVVAVAEGYSSDPIRFSVTSRDVEEIRVTLVPAVAVTGQISIDGRPGAGARGGRGGAGRGDLQDTSWGETQVALARNSRDLEWRVRGKISSDGSFLIANVGIGSYDVLVDPLPEGMFLKSVRGGPQDLLANPLRVNANPPASLTIVLSSTGAAVDGIVVDRAGNPAPGAQVVLIPNSSAREDLYKVAWANGRGRFRIAGISPGAYAAMAFEDIPPDAQFAFAYDPAMSRFRFASWTATLRIGESGQSDLRLRVIPASETVGGLR